MQRDYQDLIGGSLLVVLGAGYALYAADKYNLGALTEVGPGMFPMALGCILAVLGLFIVVPALCRGGTLPSIELRPLVLVLASTAFFAFTIARFGLVPAVAGTTLIASLADRRLSWPARLALMAGLTFLALLIFRVGLDLQVPSLQFAV